MQKGLFVALEGNDGAGKTTAAQSLLKRLKKDGFDVIQIGRASCRERV
nr:hypothetical protein [Ileibacterium valens]